MNDRDIDEALRKAAQTPHAVEPALLERIAGTIQPAMWPVRPLPQTWVLALGVAGMAAVIALAGALRAGLYGIEKMDALERVVIFSTLALLGCGAAMEFVNAMIPGSRRRISAGKLLAIGSAVLVGMFAALFHDYHTEHFVHAGILCLVTGVLHAIPVGLLSWLFLRRGFALNRVAAGVVCGILAGVAGVTVLELHCVNFEALHILVWHTAVVPVSAALGALVGSVLDLSRSD